jgi:uncharacterized protein YfaS (alpha-2-macroglobulin family)/tetratricopeptide (TPR) repeat protein
MKTGKLISLTLAFAALFLPLCHAQEDAAKQRTQAEKLTKQGNYKESLEIYKKLLDGKGDAKTGQVLSHAYSNLQQLRRTAETDELIESAVTKHQNNTQLLITAGNQYINITHYGYIVAGEFQRGHHRGGGQYSMTTERDRVRALQILTQALNNDPDDAQKSRIYTSIARALMMNSSNQGAWRLQKLTDLTKLPDIEPGSRWHRGGRNPQGAPVDTEGTPLYYQLPESWDAAKNDGERWRFCLHQNKQTMQWAQFLHSQFGVGTMRSFGWFSGMAMDDQKGILQLHTLADDETVAKLANGVKRFKLPDDQNFIRIYRELSKTDPHAADRLIQIYLDRRQHEKAVVLLKETIEQFPKDNSLKDRKKLLKQIIGNWGRFEPSRNAYPVGTEPSINYVFRNAKSVTLTAREVDINAIIDNAWDYLQGNPAQLDWQKFRWSNLADELVSGGKQKFLGKEVGKRTHDLKPRDHHWDTRATLSVPTKKAGVYLISAQLENGVTAHTVVWVDALTLVRKDIKDGELFYVADSVTGKPVAGVKLDFLGFDQVRLKNGDKKRRYDVITKSAPRTSGKDGTVFIKNGEMDNKYQWMVRAKSDKGQAFFGFGRIHSYIRNHGTLSNTKAFGITDRPVYQPKQKVFGKFWYRQASYELKDVSTYAGNQYTVHINAPDGAEVYKSGLLTADAYGGVQYTYELPEDAKLGSYRIILRRGNSHLGSHHFRIEEYKKPEFEVVVDAPKDAVKLGEKFSATVKANYYHGAPVAEAKVKVKVMRTRHNDKWFPVGRWDWLYGNGYGWLDIERPWFPGWGRWGCGCPSPWWWHRGGEQPEIVLEQEIEIGADGTVKVEVDTALAKAVHSDTDHQYTVTAEVVDASRRTIVGNGKIIAARKAYNVSVWLDRGYANVGDPINASIASRTADGKHVPASGKLTLYRITTDKDGKVAEKEVEAWKIKTTADTNATHKFQAGNAGQYRLAATLTDTKGRKIEGAILFTVRGDGEVADGFQYNNIELIADKRTYTNGSTVKLLINTKRPNSTVLLSLRGGIEHRILNIAGQSTTVDIPVSLKDMPNFFIEAATVSDAQVHTAVREIIVPPEKRVLNVAVLPSGDRFKPRAEGKVKVRVTDQHGEPVKGSLALTIYDKSLEYISGGSNVADIKTFFWKWRRHFSGGYAHTGAHYERNVVRRNAESMRTLGAFGHSLADFADAQGGGARGMLRDAIMEESAEISLASAAAPEAPRAKMARKSKNDNGDKENGDGGAGAAPAVMIRKDFADLIKWIGSVETDDDGVAEVPVTFPDNLTTWKIKTWAMAHGTRVGEGSAEVITSKDLIIRLQAPRFFVEKDEVVLSAVVHNYLKTDLNASVSLELEGGTMKSNSPLEQKQLIKAGGETRIDWRCKVTQEGTAIVRMKVITEDDSDAMEMTFPVYVHGILKQMAWSRVIAPNKNSTAITVKVPAERRPEQTRLEVRYSPTIAGSIVDALPYLVEYPYGCTEQTLNRFVPTVIAQKLIKEMGIDLEDVRNKRANLNPQEIGDDKVRMAQWKRWQRNPVFSEKEVNKMTAEGIKKLAEMQLTDGGWGWFSGWGERSYPHTTAVVVHGMLIAKKNGASIPDGMIKSGVNWLKNYEAKETERIRMWKKRKTNTKQYASSMDAFVRLVLAEANTKDKDANSADEMLGYLFRDKNHLPVYAKAVAGMAHHLAEQNDKRDAIIRNIEQFLVHDNENQTAYLKMGNGSYWWYWYGSEIEAHAWYLKLLAATKPKSKQARGLVKYLINNRKHATYWNSTRDTAYCIEAIADYMRASGENNPEAEVTVSVDGKKIKSVKITKENLFSYDNKVVLAGDALGTGEHKVEISRKGNGALYTNAYLTVFTKENFIKKAGLEVKVDRAYYKLERIDATESTAGTSGQVVDHKVEKYKRIPLKRGDMLTSGDLVEVELHIHSKNDYEYLMFNDWKPAGLESVEVRSGYTSAHKSGMHAYMEMRNEKTSFFVRQLARGSHSVKYRLRAEIPGHFSALPAMAEAMYAPELKANSDEMKIKVKDKK